MKDSTAKSKIRQSALGSAKDRDTEVRLIALGLFSDGLKFEQVFEVLNRRFPGLKVNNRDIAKWHGEYKAGLVPNIVDGIRCQVYAEVEAKFRKCLEHVPIQEQVQMYIKQTFHTLTVQQAVMADPKWVMQQTAEGMAILQSSNTQHAIRILAAAQAAGYMQDDGERSGPKGLASGNRTPS